MLVTVGVAVGFCADADERPGPLQANEVAPPPGLAVRFTVPPSHIYPLFAGAAVGVGLTATDVVYIVEGLQPGLPLPSTNGQRINAI